MKQKLLSFAVCIATAALSSVAFAWNAPVVPEKPTKAGDFVPGGNYFVRVAACGQYLTGGNAWSTQISLTKNGINDEVNQAMILTIDSLTLTYSSTVVAGLGMKVNGSYQVNGANGVRTISNTYFFRDADNGFVDWGSQTKGRVWTISKQGDYYRIQTAANDPSFPNAANQYAGWNSEGSKPDSIANTEVKFQVVPGAAGFESYEVDWEFVPAEEYLTKVKAYGIRVELLAELQRADSLVKNEGYIIDFSAIAQVYENEAATVDELSKALADIKTLVNRAEFKKKWEAASEDNPLDVTDDCLVNPDFSLGNISGWECTFKQGVNCENLGYQSTPYDNTGGKCLTGEYGSKIEQFIEAWSPADKYDGVVGDGTLQQTVYGMPAGKYVLHADIIAVDQYNSNNPVKGVYLFIQAGEFEATKSVATDNVKPEHFSVSFVNDGADVLTFGLKTKSAQANWIAADNFKIFYYGESTDSPALATLKMTIKTAKDVNLDETYAYAPVKQAFADTLAMAENAVSQAAGDEAYIALDNSLKNSINLLSASVKEYQILKDLIIKVENTENKIEAQWPTLYDQLAEWREDVLIPAYTDGTYTMEDITAAQAQLPKMIRDFISVSGNVKQGDDLTIVIENADFSLGAGNKNIPGWTIKSGSITELSSVYHNIEAYHKSFDFGQTIANMPAGVYEVGVQGFVRVDDGQAESTMKMYAGASTSKFKLLTDEYNLYPLLGNAASKDSTGKYTESDGNWPRDSKQEGAGPQGETVYRPNSMEGANNYFQEINPLTEKPFYLNTVKIVHLGGDLEIGLTCTSTHEWILWDNFTMKYAGNDISLYYGLIDDNAAELQKIHNAEDAFVTKEGQDQYDAVMTRVDQKSQLTTSDEALKLIADIKDVANYLKAGSKAGAELKSLTILYGDALINVVTSTEPTFTNTLSTIVGLVANPIQFANNDTIPSYVVALKKAWSAYCLYDGKSATEAQPWAQASSIILTPDYTDQIELTNSSIYWTVDNNIGGGNNFACNLSAMECWNDSSVLVYQDLYGLYKGFYKITLQGFYRPGEYASITNDSVANIHYAKIFGTSSVNTFEVGMKNIAEGGQAAATGEGDVSISVPSKGTIYIPNSMAGAATYFANELYTNELVAGVGEDGALRIGIKMDKDNYLYSNWLMFTGWRLSYLGEQTPAAIEQVSNESEVVRIQYFDLNGRALNSLSQGINIVRQTMTDGSVKTFKVIVK